MKWSKFYGYNKFYEDKNNDSLIIHETREWEPCHRHYTNKWGIRCYVHVNQYHQKKRHLEKCDADDKRHSKLPHISNQKRICALDPIWHNPSRDGPVPKVADLVRLIVTKGLHNSYFPPKDIKDTRYRWDGTEKTATSVLEEEPEDENEDPFLLVPQRLPGPRGHAKQIAEDNRAAYITQMSREMQYKPKEYTIKETQILNHCQQHFVKQMDAKDKSYGMVQNNLEEEKTTRTVLEAKVRDLEASHALLEKRLDEKEVTIQLMSLNPSPTKLRARPSIIPATPSPSPEKRIELNETRLAVVDDYADIDNYFRF